MGTDSPFSKWRCICCYYQPQGEIIKLHEIMMSRETFSSWLVCPLHSWKLENVTDSSLPCKFPSWTFPLLMDVGGSKGGGWQWGVFPGTHTCLEAPRSALICLWCAVPTAGCLSLWHVELGGIWEWDMRWREVVWRWPRLIHSEAVRTTGTGPFWSLG